MRKPNRSNSPSAVRLSWSDIDRVNRVVARFRSRARGVDVETAYLEAVKALVPGDVIIVALQPEVAAMRCSDAAALNTMLSHASIGDLASHPTFLRRTGNARTISDFSSRDRWHRTACYQNIFRVLGLEDDLGIDVALGPGAPPAQCCVMRSWRRFSEEDHVLLTLLAAHLPAAVHEAKIRENARQGIENVLRGGVILIDAHGRLVEWSAETRAAVVRIFGCTQRAARSLPGELREWLKGEPSRPLVVTGGGARAVFHFIRDEIAGGMIVMRNLGAEVSLHDDRLTPREREVLGWAVEGLRNGEIASRLGISPGTVKRHLENAFGKLGVRSRVEAAGIFHPSLRG